MRFFFQIKFYVHTQGKNEKRLQYFPANKGEDLHLFTLTLCFINYCFIISNKKLSQKQTFEDQWTQSDTYVWVNVSPHVHTMCSSQI